MPQARSKPKVVAAVVREELSSKVCAASASATSDKNSHWPEMFSNMACAAAHWMGKPIAFLVALLAVIVWAATGPIFHYSDTWQLVINTSTTIVTFLMVFLIQNTQNRDTMALQAKLDELIVATGGADNKLVLAEELTDDEFRRLKSLFEMVAYNRRSTRGAALGARRRINQNKRAR